MSIICQTFVQNAWRSDLCSNCFKSLEDHSEGTKTERLSTPHRYVPQATSLYQSRGISSTLKWRLSEPIYERVARRDFASQTPPKSQGKGILVKERKSRSRSSVDFASEEALVIGYGGNDYDSDLSPWEMGSDDGSVDLDLLDDTDEDRKITKMTKKNTEFNSSNQNLLVTATAVEHSQMDSVNSNNSSTASTNKSLNITHNNIQNVKKLDHYYYPSSTEALKSYLSSNGKGTLENSLENNKERSKSLENIKINNCKQDNLRLSNVHSKSLLNNDFTPLNTRTYSFVSELNKNSSDHSSDSDYSTCRLTAGDSTDSESFQDADESKMEPCPSFLHGNFPKHSSNSKIQDKKYDEESSTSGDVSNLSDDSDAHDSSEVIPYRLKIVRNSPESVEEPLPNSTRSDNKSIQIKVKEYNPKVTRHSAFKVVLKGNDDKFEDLLATKEHHPSKIIEDEVNVSIHSFNSVMNLKNNKNNHNEENSGDSKSTKDTVTKIDSTHSKTCFVSSENKKTELKTDLHNDSNVTTYQVLNPPNSHIKCHKSERSSEDNTQNMNTKNSFDYDDVTDCESSPDTIAHRQSKLAALALELELARRDSARPMSVNIPVSSITLTEIQSVPHQPPAECYPAILKNSAVTCSSNLSLSPDALQAAKSKKNRFSLKKLLKRNKDSGTFAPPTGKESNPKAWKKQSFDRSRLSLEIVHPMDMAHDAATSGDSTPTDDCAVNSHPGKGLFKSVCNRARSLSALPQVSGDDRLPDCRKVETLPSRKAGTVAERKKNRPSLVRTPSCSALPNRIQPSSSSDRSPPPKPPPPPKHKAQPPPPPPPPHQLRAFKSSNSPARPPPPKIPEVRFRKHPEACADKEYANLGDIRSQLIPKKPQRPSAASATRESEDGKQEGDAHLDERVSDSTSRLHGRPWLDLQSSYSAIAAANYESLAEIISATASESSDQLMIFGRSLKLKDFALEETTEEALLENRIVCGATYRSREQEKVTLMIVPRRSNVPMPRSQTRCPVLASFTDLHEKELASVYVLQRSRLSSFRAFASKGGASSSSEVHLRDCCFVLLQLIHTLKGLQAEGIEEVHLDLDRLLLVTTHDLKPPVFVLFPEDKSFLTGGAQEKKTLCQATLTTLRHFLDAGGVKEGLAGPVAHTFGAIADALSGERASSLTQAKGFLEYMLWGPVDVERGDDASLVQRWLDLQRAQMVKSTVPHLHSRGMHIFEEYQLIYLLQASVESLKAVVSKL